MQNNEEARQTESLRLRLLKRGRVLRSFRVKAKTLTIGSGQNASVRVKGVSGLAPEHALVWLDGGVPTLVPSSGATVLVNGSPISQATRLGSSDIVTLGGVDVQVEAALEPVEPVAVEHVTAAPAPAQPFGEDERTVPDMALAEMLEELTSKPEHAAPPAPLGAPFADRLLPEPRLPTLSEVARTPAPAEERAIPLPQLDGDDDSDEDDEESFVEPFSLVSHLEQKLRALAAGPREGYVVAQVVRHSEGRVWNVEAVRPGQRYRTEAGALPLLQMRADGSCDVHLRPEVTGRVGHGDSEEPVERWRQAGSVRLGEGDWASLEVEGCSYLIHLIRPPRAERPGLARTVANAALMLVYTVAMTVVAAGGALAFSLPGGAGPAAQVDSPPNDEVRQESFAMIAATLDVPEDEPVEPAVEETSDDSRTSTETERGPPERLRRTVRSSAGGGGGGGAASRLLASLQRGGGGGPSSSFSDVITNIDSIGSGSQGLFNITGLTTGLPDGDVRIARHGGGPGAETIGGAQLRGASPLLGVVEPTGRRRGPPRGRPTVLQARPTGTGRIDPAAVRNAINAQIGRITRCYESRLLVNESLAGRIVLTWTISTSGSPSGVQVPVSTVADPQVGTCVAGVIRQIRFPAPTGGTVQISFPFMFRPID